MTLSELNVATQSAVLDGHGDLEVRVVALNGDDDFIGTIFDVTIGETYRFTDRGHERVLVFDLGACSTEGT